jgi:inosine/xanthosine triphosphate pyrophosphatase family protein
LAALGKDIKQRISHRAQALSLLAVTLSHRSISDSSKSY